MKLATWNINSLGVRLPQVLQWLAVARPDVLALQELKLTDDKFPLAELKEAGYHAVFHGQKTYNGVALLSLQPLSAVVKNIPGFDDDHARVIAASLGELRLVCGYFPNGQAPGSDKFAYKMRWLQGLREWLAGELAQHPQLALMGDFNIAPEDADVCDPVAWAGQIHCTDEERDHFRALVGLGLHDSFRLFEQPPRLFSWWDYRMLAFRKNEGLRIDHILVSDALKPRVLGCSIDKLPRKNERPSDHAPVIVEIA
jgi:exodeoxyribonuclease III